MRRHPAKVDGVKVSLLDADHEIALRARLAAAAGGCGSTPATTSTTRS